MARFRLCAVLLLVVLAGCTLPGSPDQFDTDREPGYIGDYAHDDEFVFDDSATLTSDQLEDVKYRSMARIEVLRGLKFEHDVELDVMSRAEYRERRSGSPPASAFANELWRGAFVVDGETDVNQARDQLYGGAVQGYYVNDRIVLVVEDADANEISVDRGTLVHELVHALQDQHFGLARYGGTLDAQRAETGLIEGEANYLPYLYEQRCGVTWQCLSDTGVQSIDSEDADAGVVDDDETAGVVADPAVATAGAAVAPGAGAPDGMATPQSAVDERPFNIGLFLSIYAPYSEGPPFVAALHEREDGDWNLVDRAYEQRPASTSQLIHPDRYPDDDPVEVAVPDRSSDEWDPVTVRGGDEPRTETVGEATLFATMWANGVIDRPIGYGGTDLSPYNYSAPATDGWAGDTFQVYRDAEDDRTGHVWKLAWESDDDAAAFADGYRTLLANQDAESVDTVDDGEAYRIPDGESFAGAYRVTVTDETVTVVGAPTVGELDAVHATADISASVGSVDVLDPAPTALPAREGDAATPMGQVATIPAIPATPATPATVSADG